MLDFQEGFFEPEIRDGFFVDATMKTVWAAGLEVLQAVAEVCEKYHLVWYAAYGTLLGAIRHEGFIPWDDDIDIIMLRSDYMKLLRVLPQELPEGFHVKSPLTEEGYTEYHTCVMNGGGMSIAPGYLNKFHNCSFTVGVDIFPMDYLPRNEGESIVQINLLKICHRVVTMIHFIKEDIDISEPNKEMSREDIFYEMKYGMKELEKLCKVKLDYTLIEEKKWNELTSQIWALANKIAMIYGPEDADYLVSYPKWDERKYEKKWFQEVYSAAFENFMIPIPCGYEECLKLAYGDYHVKVRGDAAHEYPYYSKQLRKLRKMFFDIEGKLEKAEGLNVEKYKDPIWPGDWQEMLDGRKVVLFSDDIQLYAEYGVKALDKLEEVLNGYKERCGEILLWWRPQEQLKTLLGLLSQDLVDRYDGILKAYKEEKWGICDESHDEDRAAEQCDEYYGGMNYIAKSMKDNKKPVMIENLDE